MLKQGFIVIELSDTGKIVDKEIRKLNTRYDCVSIDKYSRGELRSPAVIDLSTIGKIVDKEIQKLNFIISINADENGRTQFAPTVSRYQGY